MSHLLRDRRPPAAKLQFSMKRHCLSHSEYRVDQKYQFDHPSLGKYQGQRRWPNRNTSRYQRVNLDLGILIQFGKYKPI